MGYLVAAFAGVFALNAVPHLTKGMTGRRHKVPWATPASAPVNVLWGSANVLAAIWLGVWAAALGVLPGPALTAGLLAGTAFGVYLAHEWEHDPAARGE
jgi:hypothetical protein